MRTPMSARVAPMEQAPAPAMLVPLDGDQRLALGLDLRADEVRCVALRQDGSIIAPAVTHRLENVALLGAVAALANAARAYVEDVGRAWSDVACVGVARETLVAAARRRQKGDNSAALAHDVVSDLCRDADAALGHAIALSYAQGPGAWGANHIIMPDGARFSMLEADPMKLTYY